VVTFASPDVAVKLRLYAASAGFDHPRQQNSVHGTGQNCNRSGARLKPRLPHTGSLRKLILSDVECKNRPNTMKTAAYCMGSTCAVHLDFR
jgi:hypothetical protein